ncbi:MAG TPA: hypothetical protein PLO50_01665 [Nitrospira sp.]|nr:hypothetical protein [Nitrospira sp.]
MWQQILAIILLVLPVPVLAADVTPPPASPQAPNDSPSRKSPGNMPPAIRDQGMVKQPETAPHPDSVVNPPAIDPKMAVDPAAETKEERHPLLAPEQTPQPTK